MSGYYIYTQARDAAWRFILRNKLCELPVQLFDICQRNGIVLLRDPDNYYLCKDQHGVTYVRNSRFCILVNGKDSLEEQRFTIAHELGHIFLRHKMTDDGKYGRNYGVRLKPETPQEYQAERFAMNILAPACVLWMAGLTSTDEIAKNCNIPIEYARVRADRMRELRNRNRFGTSKLEQEVMEQFSPYIERINEIKASE